MDKLAKQVGFNIIIFIISLAAIWLSGSVAVLDCIPLSECLTADFLFLLITTLAGLQGTRIVEGYAGFKKLDVCSVIVQVVFLVVYGVAIPLRGEAFVATLIKKCIWLFGFAVLYEYGVIFWHTKKNEKNPNTVSDTKRQKNDKH